jgi:hypothetical protein
MKSIGYNELGENDCHNLEKSVSALISKAKILHC